MVDDQARDGVESVRSQGRGTSGAHLPVRPCRIVHGDADSAAGEGNPRFRRRLARAGAPGQRPLADQGVDRPHRGVPLQRDPADALDGGLGRTNGHISDIPMPETPPTVGQASPLPEDAAEGHAPRLTDRIEESKAQRPDALGDPRLHWWRSAGFGAMVHWGLYALPEDRWVDRYPPRHQERWTQEWVMFVRRIPVREYARLAEAFCPRRFDPEAWLDTFESAGQRYLVVTAKHHDGFCLFQTRHTDFNVVTATPYARDIIAQLAEACARRNLPFGLYYSQTQDWSHPDGYGNDWDCAPAPRNFQRYLDELVHPQMEELLTHYGPIAILWFDTPMILTPAQSRALLEQVRGLQPACLVNGRIGHGLGDYATTRDNQYLTSKVNQDWECPATLNDTWGYRASDTHWKSASTLFANLQRVRATGGNYLLNVGPDATGRIPDPCPALLRQLGERIASHPGIIRLRTETDS